MKALSVQPRKNEKQLSWGPETPVSLIFIVSHL